MLVDLSEEGAGVEEAALPAAAVVEEAVVPEAPSPAVDDTFLRIEELELDMLEEVVEEELLELRAAEAETATMIEAEPLEEEVEQPGRGSHGVGRGRSRDRKRGPAAPMSVSELEADMLVDYMAGEGTEEASVATQEEPRQQVSEGLEGLEDDLEALERNSSRTRKSHWKMTSSPISRR